MVKCLKNKQKKQIKAIEDHRKQLLKSINEKEFLALLKQKEIFEELANERMKMQNLSKRINFNNSIYYFKDDSGPKDFIGFKDPVAFIKK